LTVEEKLTKAVRITDRETKAYVYAARSAGQTQAYIGDSPKLWAINTLAEHYISLPAADDPGVDVATELELVRLADEANAAFDAGEKVPDHGAKYGIETG
jgi:hypothetical protein